jgi:hypothetical protein
MFRMPGRSHRGPLPALTADEAALRDRLRGHVEHLSATIGERNLSHPRALEAAAGYIEESLAAAGLRARAEPFTVSGHPVRNVVAEVTGRAPAEIVVVGAHYDTVPGCPGADDNATGVAALIEIARACAGRPLGRTVRLVGFVNEEPPFFQTDAMGSLRHARAARDRREQVVAMISLESIGIYDDTAGSQEYPFPLASFYPDRGDFLAFVANRRSAPLVRRAIASFRRHTAFPSEGLAAPEWLPGVGWSDQWAFWQAGYQAVMVTDTAPFRYAHYHRPSDTAERIDGERLARVVAGLGRVALELAGTKDLGPPRYPFEMAHTPRNACPHLDASKTAATSGSRACDECGLERNLRLCLTCGYVGCCESEGAHDTAHYQKTGHPLITPHRSEARWLWCYACGAYLD